MKFRYTSFFPPERTAKWIKRPIVQIEVLGPAGKRTFEALIDSGADVSLTIPVSFVQSPQVGLLLGQEGFFDQYRVKFEKDHDAFEVTPVRR